MSWISNVINIFKGAVEVKDFLFVPITPCNSCHGNQARLEKLDGGWIVHCPDGHCRNRTAGEYRFRRQAKIAWRDQAGQRRNAVPQVPVFDSEEHSKRAFGPPTTEAMHTMYSIDGGDIKVWESGQPCPEELKPYFEIEEK